MTRLDVLLIVEVATSLGLGVEVTPAAVVENYQGTAREVPSWIVEVNLEGATSEAFERLKSLRVAPSFGTGVLRFGGES